MSTTVVSIATERGGFRDYRFEEDLNPQRPGSVFRATSTGETVVVKKLDAEVLRDPELLSRVREEVMQASELDHPHVARVQWFAEGQGAQVVIREFVRGSDLTNFAGRSRLAVEDACHVALQVARGLQAMREQGLAHLAIHPSHIVLEESGTAKILGLGFAPLHASRFHQTTAAIEDRHGERFDYTAPELARGREDVGVQADIYSLGCILRYLLTGDSHLRLPLQSNVAGAAEALHIPANVATSEQLPAGLVEIIEKMTFDLPEDRYAEPLHVVEALEPFARASKLRQSETRERPPSERPGTAACLQTSEAAARMRAVAVGLATLFLVACAALVFGYLWSQARAAAFHKHTGLHPVLGQDDETALGALGVTTQLGRNGAWWVDEFPWLLPPVRQRIALWGMAGKFSLDDELLTTGRFDPRWEPTSVEQELAKLDLPSAIFEITNHFTNVVSGEPAAGKSSAGSYEAIYATLSQNDRSAAEIHLQAIVMHKRARHQPRPQNGNEEALQQYQKRWDDVEEQYKLALAEYAWNEVGLISLCWSDYGRLLRDAGRHLEAAQAYRKARELLCHYLGERLSTEYGECPYFLNHWENSECLYFFAECLTNEAAAYRAIGQLARAQDLLEDAQTLLGVSEDDRLDACTVLPEQFVGDANSLRTFASYVLERSGWLYMDRWRVQEARHCFEFANRLRKANARPLCEEDALDFEEEIRIQHNEHGIAMAKLYEGRPNASRKAYHTIQSNLSRMVDDHLGLPGSGVARSRPRNSAEYQGRVRMLQDRRINTFERLADCELYGTWHDGEWQGHDAKTWLDEALRLVDERDLLGRMDQRVRARIYYKKAIVLVMQARDSNAESSLRQRDLKKAKELRRAADELIGAGVPPPLAFLGNLCGAFLEYEWHRDNPKTGGNDVKFAEAIWDQFLKLQEENLVSRDELDLLLLLTACLPDQISEEDQRLRKAQLILRFARLPFWEHPLESIDEITPPPIVRYLGSFVGPEPSELSEVEKTWWEFFRRSRG